jgi:hypothetical protein
MQIKHGDSFDHPEKVEGLRAGFEVKRCVVFREGQLWGNQTDSSQSMRVTGQGAPIMQGEMSDSSGTRWASHDPCAPVGLGWHWRAILS